jgi:CRP/FNR family cyclic AMP-dependent transcriptional regulator
LFLKKVDDPIIAYRSCRTQVFIHLTNLIEKHKDLIEKMKYNNAMLPKGKLHRYVQHYSAGTLIFREGDIGDRMFIILEGQINIRKKTGDQSYKSLTTLYKGDVFGEMAIVEQKPRSASALTEKDSQLMVLNRSAFYTLVSENSEFAIKMIKSLSARLRKADYLIEQILGADIDKQIYQGLCTYFEQKKQNDTLVASGRISQRDFVKWTSLNLGINADTIRSSIANLAQRHILHYWKNDPDDPQLQVSVQAMMKNRY